MQLSSKPSLKTALSEWRKLLFAHFLRLIVYFANQHFSQEWSIFEGYQHFQKRRQNSNDCDVIRLNRVNPKLWRTILASEDASEKTFLTNTSKSCWKKNQPVKKNYEFDVSSRHCLFLRTKLFLASVPPKEIRQLAPKEIATSWRISPQVEENTKPCMVS